MNKLFSKHIIKAFVVASLCLGANSCKVEVEPTDRYTDVTVWKNPGNIKLYIYGMYNEFKTFSFGRIPLGYNNATDALADLMKYTSTSEGNGSANRLAFDPSRVNSNSPNINYWATGYERIRRVNEFMMGMDKYATIDDNLKKQYQAEARFIRAYCYFWLVKINGSVILLDKATTDGNNPRSSEDDCWNFIAADLAFAAENLPVSWPASETGRATKGAAYGMLARTWLYAASIADYDNKQFNTDALTGVPATKKDAYYKNAANAAAEVIKLADAGNYELETNFADVFTKANSKESVFSVNYVRPNVTHDFDNYFAPPRDLNQPIVAGVPTAELVDEFEMKDGTKFSWSNPAMAANPYTNRDPRFYATVLYNGAAWKGRTMNTTPGDALEGYVESNSNADPRKTVTGYYIRKMLDPANTNILVDKSVQPWHEMRYAEVLLIHAEAAAKSGDINSAKESLNKVRTRAGLPGTTASTLADMMTAVEHERKVELAFEGHRYWDLRRWRKAHIVLNNTRFHGHRITQVGSSTVYEVVDIDKQNRSFPATFYYMPIPQAEITRNSAITQIQGW